MCNMISLGCSIFFNCFVQQTRLCDCDCFSTSAADMKVTQRSFNFGKKQGLPFYFVSAADGTNVVKVWAGFFLLLLFYVMWLEWKCSFYKPIINFSQCSHYNMFTPPELLQPSDSSDCVPLSSDVQRHDQKSSGVQAKPQWLHGWSDARIRGTLASLITNVLVLKQL